MGVLHQGTPWAPYQYEITCTGVLVSIQWTLHHPQTLQASTSSRGSWWHSSWYQHCCLPIVPPHSMAEDVKWTSCRCYCQEHISGFHTMLQVMPVPLSRRSSSVSPQEQEQAHPLPLVQSQHCCCLKFCCAGSMILNQQLFSAIFCILMLSAAHNVLHTNHNRKPWWGWREDNGEWQKTATLIISPSASTLQQQKMGPTNHNFQIKIVDNWTSRGKSQSPIHNLALHI